MELKKCLTFTGKEIVYGGHLLSLGGVSIAFVSALILGIETTLEFHFIVYLGFQAIYLFNRYQEFSDDRLTNPERTDHLQFIYRWIPVLVCLCLMIFFAVLICFEKKAAFYFQAFTISLGLLYSVFLKKMIGRVPGLKGVFVAACWSTAIIFLILYYEQPFTWAVLFLIIFTFLRWFVNTTVCDVKDMEDDRRKGIITLPITIGLEKLIVCLKVITLVSALPLLVGVYLKLLPPLAGWLLFTVPYSFYYLHRINRNKNDSFTYNVIIDGEFVLWSVFITIGRYLY